MKRLNTNAHALRAVSLSRQSFCTLGGYSENYPRVFYIFVDNREVLPNFLFLLVVCLCVCISLYIFLSREIWALKHMMNETRSIRRKAVGLRCDTIFPRLFITVNHPFASIKACVPLLYLCIYVVRYAIFLAFLLYAF